MFKHWEIAKCKKKNQSKPPKPNEKPKLPTHSKKQTTETINNANVFLFFVDYYYLEIRGILISGTENKNNVLSFNGSLER